MCEFMRCRSSHQADYHILILGQTLSPPSSRSNHEDTKLSIFIGMFVHAFSGIFGFEW